jgi:Spy/CpxP family protein refolding chaperone
VKNSWIHAFPAALLIVMIVSLNGQAQGSPPRACLQHGETCLLNDNAEVMYLAQVDEPSPPDDYRRGQGQRGEKRGRMGWGKESKHIEQFRLLKLLELLDLKEDQEVDFIKAFRTMRSERRDLHEKRMELVNRLADGLRDQNIADNEIREHVQQISELAKQEGRVMDDFFSTAQRILTPQQLGKLIVFQERFELELLEGVREFQERQQGAFEPENPPAQPPFENERKDSF